MDKPLTVEVGQAWRCEGMQGRPLFVIGLVRKRGCCPKCIDNESELWAIFRKGKQDVVHHMLESPRWQYLGTSKV